MLDMIVGVNRRKVKIVFVVIPLYPPRFVATPKKLLLISYNVSC